MNIKIAILEVLDRVDPMAQMKSHLRKEVELLGGNVGDTEFAEALHFLEGKGYIGTCLEEMSGDTRYNITRAGKTKASQ